MTRQEAQDIYNRFMELWRDKLSKKEDKKEESDSQEKTQLDLNFGEDS